MQRLNYLLLFLCVGWANISVAMDVNRPPVQLLPFNQLDAWSYDSENIETVMRSVAEFQLKQYGDLPGPGWTTGTFYSSFIAAYKVTGDRWYLKQAQRWANHVRWHIKKVLHADELCPAQTYLDLHFLKKNKASLSQLNTLMSEAYFDRTQINAGELHDWDQKTYPFDGRNLWSWADALYMAPPVLARMGKATGDQRYYQLLHKLYWDAVDNLYDEEEQLLFRNGKPDSALVTSPSGEKVFWSRGMGWVVAGLVRTLDYLEESDPEKERYVELFKTLAYSLVRYQQYDGLWRSSLTEPSWHATKETSGSAFFTFAIAKGVNEGWLPKQYFLPVLLKAWSGLAASIEPGGKMGYSQIVAGSPHEVRARDSVDYAAGALILAGSEMLRLDALESMHKVNSQPLTPRIVATDAEWPAENNHPVIKHKAVFYALHSLEDGETALTAFTGGGWPNVSAYARKQKILKGSGVQTSALIGAGDENLLTIIGAEKTSQRFIHLPLWQEMAPKELTDVSPESRSWVNIQFIEQEKTLLQFYLTSKGPSISVSKNQGTTWEKPQSLFADFNLELQSSSLRAASNQNGRIDLLLQTEKGLYHFFYKNNKVISSSGEPVWQSSGDHRALAFDASKFGLFSEENSLPKELVIEDFKMVDAVPTAVVKYTDNESTRFTVFRFNPEGGWKQNKLLEFSDTMPVTEGLSLETDSLIISSRVNPVDGKSLPNNKFQLFQGKELKGVWQWKQLTFDPARNQVNPKFVQGGGKTLFWLTQLPENISSENATVLDSTLVMSEILE